MSHGDQVQAAPEEWEVLGSTATCPMAAAKHRHRKVYTLQFHPEVVHTEFGRNLLGNFLFGVCNAPANWDMGDFVRQVSGGIRDRVGTDKVICGLSGGVDSSVCAALLAKAIGSQTVCIFVDNGLLRSGEAEEVERVFEPIRTRIFAWWTPPNDFWTPSRGGRPPSKEKIDWPCLY